MFPPPRSACANRSCRIARNLLCSRKGVIDFPRSTHAINLQLSLLTLHSPRVAIQCRAIASIPLKHLQQNQWEDSPASHDFRSDTLTTPTPSMLSSLTQCSLGDEVYDEAITTTDLERRLSTLFKKPAALFVLSGTMGNQLALRAHLNRPPHSVLCDARAHINAYEAGGLASLSQAMVQPVLPSNRKWITLEDIQKAVVLSDDIHLAPTRVISLENAINGVIVPLEEIRRISEFAKQHDLLLHLDGARLWNACSAPGAPELHEYAAQVDSLSVCFSKSLGAPVGSFVLGSEELIAHARHMRKALGGGVRQSGILTAMANVALDEVFFAGRLRVADAYAKRLEAKWRALGGEVTLPVDTNMVWLDLEGRGVVGSEWRDIALREVGVLMGKEGRIVCHYQNTVEAVERLEKVMEVVCMKADERGTSKKCKSNGTTDVQQKMYQK